MVNPWAHKLSQYVGWEWFGTLTWSGRVPSPGRARKLWFAYQYEIAALADRPFSSLVWCLRSELGEKTERHHYHFLLGNLGLSASKTTAFRMMWLWDKKLKCGHARLSPWDPSLNGISYVTECLGAGRAAGNLYELGKFRSQDSEPVDRYRVEEVEMSKSLQSWLSRRARGVHDMVPAQSDRMPGVLDGDVSRSDQRTLVSGQLEQPF
jgi:hypothetical protein